ncbi:MAG: penicillin-binding protein 2 [Chlamydiales bacterium]|nr:penicillin-binding protein 2 [Chlamydiales bacterium]
MQKQRRGLINKHTRLLIVALCLIFFFSLLIIQFFYLQIIQEEKWTKYAKLQHESIVVEPAKRGVFFSNVKIRENHPEEDVAFVIDVPKYHLFIDPLVIPAEHKEIVADKIVALLPTKYLDIEKVREECFKKSRSRKVTSWIEKDEKVELDHWWNNFAKANKIPTNAIYYIKDYQRSYPFGKLLGQVLHTVREEKDPITNAEYPTGGLELYFNHYLKGKAGKKIIERSLKHVLDTDHVIDTPKDGNDIYLTINHHLQAIAEEEIEKGVNKVGAKGGFAVMMDPYSGEIYAMAQYPFFEPMNYRKYYNDTELLEYTKIKAISDSFEPGSTFKGLTAVIGLVANDILKKQHKKPLFDPEEMLPTGDGTFPGRGPLKDTRFHAYLNMDLAIQKSSNIYVARLADKVIKMFGEKWYRNQLVEIFGIGTATNVELPYENSGLLPTPGLKYPNGQLQWSVPTPYSLAMGYNVMVNSIQMLRAISVLANGGYLISPHLVKKIVDKELNKIVYETKINKKKVLDKAIVDRIVRAMKFVTKPGGGAPLADIYGYTEAGKTGTAEKIIHGSYSKSINFSTFIGFAPVTNPRFILIACVDEPEVKFIDGIGMTQFGGKCAAPIFREIARKTLEYLGVPYDDPFGFPKGDPRSDSSKADWIKETSELTDRYNTWNEQ